MTPPTNAAATIRDVTMRFRGHTALDGVSTGIGRDSITGLLGRNGAGKTTLMQLLTGHRLPTSGSVEVLGAAPYENEGVLPGICFVKEGQRYPDHFRVRDALDAAALVYPDWDADLAAELLRDFDLPPKRPVKKLSRGMTSAVGIVIGLASRAPITLFDEPYLGLDAVARQLFYDRLLADYAEHPRTIVLSTHLIEEIAGLLERVLLIDRGRVLLDADAESLRDSAVTVTGPGEKVQSFARQHELLHTESLGGHSRAVVRQLFYDRLLADYAENPRTVVLSTHLIEEISGLLEHVLLLDAGRVLLDDDADSLRATALTVTGPADRVAALGREHEVLSTETLGASGRAILRLRRPVDPADLVPAGLTAAPTPLQQLVVALSTRSARAAAPATAGGSETHSVDYQEATR